VTILDESVRSAPGADLEFVLQQLAAIEPFRVGPEQEACNGCSKCAVESA
jgi:hypothetical protein